MEIKVRNTLQAIDSALAYLQQQAVQDIPEAGAKWQERALYSRGLEDYAITSKLLTHGDWMIEVYQGVAPLSRTVYQITLFKSKQRWYWKGNIQADGNLTETSPLKQLSEEEGRDIEAGISSKMEIPAPKPGGYGH